MAKRMLIDATHPEETRVVVLNGNKLEEFDFETSTKKQLKGNIYLAKVTRVEPSLQAAFVDYGGNRHGFLAFNEIHPDYWRIPIADREALLAEHNADHDGDMLDEPSRNRRGRRAARDVDSGETTNPELPPSDYPETASPDSDAIPVDEPPLPQDEQPTIEHAPSTPLADESPRAIGLEHGADFETSAAPVTEPAEPPPAESTSEAPPVAPEIAGDELTFEPARATDSMSAGDETGASADEAMSPDRPVPVEAISIESVGGDDMEEVETRRRFKPMRHYKIQEVIKRRQVLLVQVVKEERGTKGAALTTYLSLAGRYCVLMPNTARGGGISRRITSAQDRKRLKSIMEDLDMPEGMAVILRTAGMERTKPEIKRDYEYLLRQWDDIREVTLKSTAPCLVYEEGNLIKRAIRDLYSRDIEEILVEGEDGYKTAKAFMKTLMPSHAGRIQLYNDPTVPLFQRFQVEAALDEMHGPNVRLKSGGYIVINPTEALVSIDVNSGRSTRERHIEETAFKTNLEAADEIARQLRLRDLAGLIVIDFIDMEDTRNQHAVERRLKEAMKSDRARIQIGRISPFGLLELSRQRLRPSLLEVSSERCPHCAGSGFVRSTESTALHVLRAIEEEGMKMRTAEAVVHVPTSVALYMLNQKRDALASVEARYGLYVAFNRDDALIPPAYRIERTRARSAGDVMPAPHAPLPAPHVEAIEATPTTEAEPAELDESAAMAEESAGVPYREDERAEMHEGGDEGGHRRRRRRRRRRGRGEDRGGPDQHHAHEQRPHDQQPQHAAEALPEDMERPPASETVPEEASGEGPAPTGEAPHHEHVDADGMPRRRRRGRRGGRRRGRRGPDDIGQPVAAASEDPFIDPRYPNAAPETHAEPTAHEPVPVEERHPRRIEGPGDAYDWPWNRRAERFPEEQEREEAERPAAAEPHAPAPAPVEAHEQLEETRAPAAAQPTPAPEQQAADRGSDAPNAAEPEPADPSSPPRRGWWRRLTS